ncbi:hypothetical protein B7R21_12630 [Subtercola boreus]|uniref:TPM domain-containing protein n=1 Tax=Subtercola boreus TaxID=120213 RepID=A0A3E0VP93_9MICO|nr:TPM domain-containing protein [Subtercola boreus]RFA11541.1 hypothetical protein B7R21_12630 [Subtercola boreus]
MRAPLSVIRSLSVVGLALGLALGGVLGVSASASATEPVDLGGNRVIDSAGVLSAADVTAITDATEKLYADSGIDLFVAYVSTFENPASAEDWANQTASANNLGPTDYLLAVAVDGRAYYLSGDSSGPVSGSQLSTIESAQIEPQLKNDNWAGAAEAAAVGLGDAAAGGTGSSGSGGSGSSSSSTGVSGGTIGAIVIVLVLILVIVGGIIVIVFVRASRRNRLAAGGSAPIDGPAESGEPADPLVAMPIQELEREAGSMLVQTDDAVQTSTDELGFAVAQYGDEAAAPFQKALGEATAGLKQAFQLKQRLDDAEPDSDAEIRQWNTEIVRLCTEANRVLDEQAAAFDELRELEKDIPAGIAAGTAAVAAVEPRVQAAASAIVALRASYTPSAFSTVVDNPAQATERLTFARSALEHAETEQRSDTGEAAVGVRAAEEAVDQATLLLEAVDRVTADLASARGQLDSQLTNLQQDVADAHAVAAAGDPQGAIAAAAERTTAVIAEVQAQLAGPVDPAVVAQRLELANRDIDGVLGAVRSQQATAQRAASTFAQTLQSARSRVSAANDYITARRGGVGAEARTRLAEATRLVARAEELSTTDAVGALAAAQRADGLAAQAIESAQRDVGEFANGYGDGSGAPAGAGGGLFGAGGGGGGGGNGMLGAMLGGIVINSVLGGGRGGGGLFGGGGGRRDDDDDDDGFGGLFGGGSGGGFFGGGGGGSNGGGSRSGGGSFGGRSAGSFGGGGTRSRRGGGRF